MRKVLIIGGTGMLGHKLWQVARDRRDRFDVHATVHGPVPDRGTPPLVDPARAIGNVDAERFETVQAVLDDLRPDVIVNCVGAVKNKPGADDAVRAIALNSLFPRLLARAAQSQGARLIHVSTDCVFSGSRGRYSEEDQPDPLDLYGQTKALGEVEGGQCLTLRTSMIGRELRGSRGLVEWFLSRRGQTAEGYTHAIFSGLTTLALARVIADVISEHPAMTGLFHVSASPIAKHDLLVMLNEAYDAGVRIVASHRLHVDRSLISERFRAATGFQPASWREMVRELREDPLPYDEWRQQ